MIAPHADDEAIGCGGAILRLVARGFACRVLCATEGAEGVTREREYVAALAVAGATMLPGLGLRERAVHASADLVVQLADLLLSEAPNLVFAPHALEADPDHQAVSRAVTAALTVALARGIPPLALLEYEVWTPLTAPNLVMDISRLMDRKLAMIRCYTSQMATRSYDRAAFGINRYRALMHGRGSGFAEAFRVPSIKGGWTLEDLCLYLA